MNLSPAQDYEQNNLSPMVEYYIDPSVDYCDDCSAPMVWCICNGEQWVNTFSDEVLDTFGNVIDEVDA